MGSMYNSDFYNRYSIYGTDNEPSNRQRIEQLRVNSLARAENMEEDTASRYSSDRALFGSALRELGGPLSSDSAAQSAYSYAQSVVNIQNLTRGSHFDEASSAYLALRSSADRHRDAFMKYAATKPINKAEEAIQIGAMKMSRYDFDAEELQLPDGTKTTFGQFYMDGGTYKKFTSKAMIGQNFSSPVVDLYSMSTDGLDQQSKEYVDSKKSVLGIAVDPVVSASKDREGKHKYRIQHSNIADYVNGSYDSLVEELGYDGLRLLVTDAVDNRCQDGSAMMTMKYVRNYVNSRVREGDTTDKRELVRRTIDELDRQMRVIGVPANGPGRQESVMTESARRLAMLTLDSVNSGGSSPVDFDNPYVQKGMQDVMSFVAAADNMRIPVLSMMKDSGASFRDAAASYVRMFASDGTPPEDNVFKQAIDSKDTVNMLFSGGCKEVPAATDRVRDTPRSVFDAVTTLGSSSGNRTIDALRMRLSSVLWGSFILPRQFRGERADVAMQSVLSNPTEQAELVSMLSRETKTITGFSDEAVSAFVSNVLGSMTSGENGGLTPVDLTQVLVGLAGTSLSRNGRSPVSPAVSDELMKWFVATNTDDRMFEAFEQQVVPQLMDTSCGMGYRDAKDLEAAKLRLRSKAIEYIRAGKSPAPLYRAAARRGNVAVPTGNWLLPDGTLVSKNEFDILAGRDPHNKTLPDGHPLLSQYSAEDLREQVRRAFPEMTELRNYDLDELDETVVQQVVSAGGSVLLDVVPKYSFSTNPEGFRAWAMSSRQLLVLSNKLRTEGSAAAVRSAAK